MRLRLLMILAVILSGCALRPAAPQAEVALARAPDGRILAPVTIGGRGPYPFILDTGASATVLDAALARELGLAGSGGAVTIYGVSGVAVADTVEGVRLGIGEDTITLPWAAVLDLPGPGGARGVLGVDALRQRIVEVDAGAAALRLWRGGYDPPPAHRVSRADLLLEEHGLPLVELRVNSARGLALLDTGLAGMTLDPGLARRAGVPAQVEPVTLTDATSESLVVRRSGRALLAIGDARWRVAGVALLRPDVLDLIEPRADVILGASLLAEGIVAIDLAGRKLYIVDRSVRRP